MQTWKEESKNHNSHRFQLEFNLHSSCYFYLCKRHNCLTNEADMEERRVHRKDLNPGAYAGAHNAQQSGFAQTLKVEWEIRSKIKRTLEK